MSDGPQSIEIAGMSIDVLDSDAVLDEMFSRSRAARADGSSRRTSTSCAAR